jgi:hypothetical protein
MLCFKACILQTASYAIDVSNLRLLVHNHWPNPSKEGGRKGLGLNFYIGSFEFGREIIDRKLPGPEISRGEARDMGRLSFLVPTSINPDFNPLLSSILDKMDNIEHDPIISRC